VLYFKQPPVINGRKAAKEASRAKEQYHLSQEIRTLIANTNIAMNKKNGGSDNDQGFIFYLPSRYGLMKGVIDAGLKHEVISEWHWANAGHFYMSTVFMNTIKCASEISERYM
jgi:hypothetical protein